MATDRKLHALLSPKLGEGLYIAAQALKTARVEFALVGGLALDHYADEPRFTRDIDFVVAAEEWKAAVRAIRAAGFTDGKVDNMLKTQLENKDGVRVDLLFGIGDPEESARVTAKRAKVLGVMVPVAAPEYLVWMYLLSDQRRHEEDAERLVAQGIDLPKLAAWLRQTGSTHELTRLSGIVARVRGR